MTSSLTSSSAESASGARPQSASVERVKRRARAGIGPWPVSCRVAIRSLGTGSALAMIIATSSSLSPRTSAETTASQCASRVRPRAARVAHSSLMPRSMSSPRRSTRPSVKRVSTLPSGSVNSTFSKETPPTPSGTPGGTSSTRATPSVPITTGGRWPALATVQLRSTGS